MNTALEKFCADYLADKLGPAQRKYLEERISKGDAEIVSMLAKLQGDALNVKKTKTHEERFNEEIEALSGNKDRSNLREQTKKKIAQEQADYTKENKEALKKKISFKASVKRVVSSQKTFASLILAGLLFSLVGVIAYLQAERTSLATKLSIQKTKVEEMASSTYIIKEKALADIGNYSWLVALLRQPDLITKSVQVPKYIDNSQLYFDANSLKLAFIGGDSAIPDGQVVSLWSEGTAESRLIGIINPIKKDSLYNQWNTSALLLVDAFHLRISPISDDAVSYEQTKSLKRIPLP
jgi:hypothetical protein